MATHAKQSILGQLIKNADSTEVANGDRGTRAVKGSIETVTGCVGKEEYFEMGSEKEETWMGLDQA